MTIHSVTHTTPNMSMLGREVLFPTTLIASPPERTGYENGRRFRRRVVGVSGGVELTKTNESGWRK